MSQFNLPHGTEAQFTKQTSQPMAKFVIGPPVGKAVETPVVIE